MPSRSSGLVSISKQAGFVYSVYSEYMYGVLTLHLCFHCLQEAMSSASSLPSGTSQKQPPQWQRTARWPCATNTG